jgi:hypothetical protein
MARKQSKLTASRVAVQARMVRLKSIERKLRRGEYLSGPDSTWLANGLRGYLRGVSFGHALGLVRSRGRVGTQLRLAIKIDKCQRNGLTWEQIGEKFKRTPESLQKIADRYASDVDAHNTERIAKIIAKKLD